MGRKAFTDRKCHSLSAQRGCHSQNKSPPRLPAPLAISIQPGPRRGPTGLGLGSRESLTRLPSTGKSGESETQAGPEGKPGGKGLGLRPQGTKSLIRKSNAKLEGGAANSSRGRWSWAGGASVPKPEVRIKGGSAAQSRPQLPEVTQKASGSPNCTWKPAHEHRSQRQGPLVESRPSPDV